MQVLGVRILGLSAEGLHKLLLTAAVLFLAFGIRRLLGFVSGFGRGATSRRSIWFRKAVRLWVGAAAALLLLSIWFDEPARLATFSGLIGAGIAFALQNALLSVAGYFVIVFGRVFDLGDRIEMGGVRGDVLDIGLMKTTIMEMGVPPTQKPEEEHWVGGRQYSGRVVTVVNADVFRKPVFDYTGNFDLLWEELRLPVRYDTDLVEAERLLLEIGERETRAVEEQARHQLGRMRQRFIIDEGDLAPRVYVRLTDNWMELSLRFLVLAHGAREVKDAIARDILAAFRQAGIPIASQTVEITRWPQVEAGPQPRQ